MAEVNYTLLSEGTSDRALIPVINWIIRDKRSDLAINPAWADPARFPTRPKSLADKIRYSLDFFPCDLLFVHRDSDNDQPEKRRNEIAEAVAESKLILHLSKPTSVYTSMQPFMTFDKLDFCSALGYRV